jgi:hypothetical protein
VAKKKVLKGPKVSRSHTTYIREAEPIIVALKADTRVKKVILGVITPIGPSQKVRVRVLPERAGCKISVRGRESHQTIWVHGAGPDVVSVILRAYLE